MQHALIMESCYCCVKQVVSKGLIDSAVWAHTAAASLPPALLPAAGPGREEGLGGGPAVFLEVFVNAVVRSLDSHQLY